MKSAHRVLLLAFCLSLAACSSGSSSRIDYEQAKTLPPLEVPPGLGAPIDTGTDDVPELSGESSVAGEAAQRRVLPQEAGIQVAHDGSTRWLVVERSADKLWPKLREFWTSVGLELKEDEPSLGIMETQWAENRADIPQGFFARMVKKVFKTAYSAGTLDKYRLRLEPAENNRTEVFITHYGLKEVEPKSQTGDVIETVWVVRPSDPELANEILNRLVLFLGGSKETAKAAQQAEAAQQESSRIRIDGDRLVLEEGFSRAWRLTGLALDRIGLVVEDRNRSEGIYYVSHVDLIMDAGKEKQEGWFSSLFSSSGDQAAKSQEQLQIRLNGDDTSTRISVHDAQGTPLSEQASLPVLKRLQESLR